MPRFTGTLMAADSGFLLTITDDGGLTAGRLSAELDAFGWIDASVDRGDRSMIRIEPHRGNIHEVREAVEATVVGQGFVPHVNIRN